MKKVKALEQFLKGAINVKAINFTAGLISGAIIGMAVGALMDPMSDKKKKCLKKKSSHMMRTVGATMESLADMF